MKKRISVITGLLFFAFMLLCTILARPLHNYYLPKVIVQKITKESFDIKITLEDGSEASTMRRILAVPLAAVENGKVFVIREREHYNEQEIYVTQVSLELGVKEGAYAEVIDGLGSSDKIVISCDRPIQEGQTVIVR